MRSARKQLLRSTICFSAKESAGEHAKETIRIRVQTNLERVPGEHQVYVIHFDEWWEIHPPIPKTDEMSITLKAI